MLFVRPVLATDLLQVINATGMSAHKAPAAPVAVLYGAESNRQAGLPENTGVMFMNVPRFQRLFPAMLAFGRERNFSFPAFDQGWLNAFFSEKMPTGRALLDVHWNWKVYWGGSLWKLHCGEGKGEPERDSTCQSRLKHSPYIVHFHGPKPGRGNFLECLASMNNACLAKLSREHPYWTLCNNGFRADGGFLANSSLRLYQRFSADCHEWWRGSGG